MQHIPLPVVAKPTTNTASDTGATTPGAGTTAEDTPDSTEDLTNQSMEVTPAPVPVPAPDDAEAGAFVAAPHTVWTAVALVTLAALLFVTMN